MAKVVIGKPRIVKEKISAGPEVDFTESLWQPTGTADAVFYLGERVAGQKKETFKDGEEEKLVWMKVVTVPSQEEDAMRYLKPCSEEWHYNYPGRHGLTTCPSIKGSTGYIPKELRDKAKELGVKILHQICSESPLAEDPRAIQRGKDVKWVKTKEGMWCVFLLKSS